jgi:hypothetical protein
LRAQGRHQEAWRFFLTRHFLGLFLFVASVLTVVCLGNTILKLWGSKTQFLETRFFLFMALIYLLECNHGGFSFFIMTANEVPFVIPAILSGVAIAVGGWFCVQHFGLWGLLCVLFLVQLSWNNWWVPLYAWKSIRRNQQ